MQTSDQFNNPESVNSLSIFLSSYPNALSVISVSAIILDNQFQILAVNTAALHELGLAKNRLIKKQLSQILSIYRDKQDILAAVLTQLTEAEPILDLPTPCYIRLKGSEKKFYIKGQFITQYSSPKDYRIIFLFRNIEEELTQESLLNMALAQTKIFPWFFDMEQSKMNIDHRWFTHLGIPTQDCTLSPEEFFERVHPDERDGLLQALSQQISGQLTPEIFTYRLKKEDGSWEWFEEQSIYLGREGGMPYRIVGICQSIQEHKSIEEHLIAARDKAKEADQLKSAFLANMSHEIRTPLNAIVGFANLLANEDGFLNGEEKKEYSRLISLNSEHLLRLISDILDLSKIESNTMEFNVIENSLNSILSDIYHTQKLNMPANVELRLDIPPTDVRLHTDSMRLKQILNNLINNAIKFTFKGNITLGYHISVSQKQVEIFVKDTGKGIPQAQQAHIFERFYKADSFVTGFGLGLSICKTIIQTLGGSISVTSKINEGSCFTVIHPL